MFGQHLILEAYGCPQELLDNLDLAYTFIDNLPNQIGMTKITQTHAFRYSGTIPEDAGISSYVLIAESHILLHSFTSKGFAALDVFTCKSVLDTEFIIEEFYRVFKPTWSQTQLLNRGREFPRSEGRADLIVSNERLTYSS